VLNKITKAKTSCGAEKATEAANPLQPIVNCIAAKLHPDMKDNIHC